MHTFANALSKAKRFKVELTQEPNNEYYRSMFNHYLGFATIWSQTDNEKKLVEQLKDLVETK